MSSGIVSIRPHVCKCLPINHLLDAGAYTSAVREDVGKAVKRLREAKGWSLDELAGSCGVDKGTLSRIELGKQNPHRATLYSIVNSLKPRPDQIAGHPRLLEAFDDAADHGGTRGGVGIEDRLSELLAYIKTLKGKDRSNFIRASIALLDALKHTGPSEATGTAPDDER